MTITQPSRPHHPGETVHDADASGAGLSLDYDDVDPGKIQVCMGAVDDDGKLRYLGTIGLTPADARAFGNALIHWAAEIFADEILDPSYCSACKGPCTDES